jgi:hypothetical protein
LDEEVCGRAACGRLSASGVEAGTTAADLSSNARQGDDRRRRLGDKHKQPSNDVRATGRAGRGLEVWRVGEASDVDMQGRRERRR